MFKQILGLPVRAHVHTLKAVSGSMCLLLCFLYTVEAQSSAFTYQGKLTDGGTAANGQYDLTFRLFDAVSGGSQIGPDVVRDDVQVATGIFTVNLDFGSSPFTSLTGNFLEISVRPGASSGAYTPLFPLQPLTSSPYSIKTLSATSADSLSAACVSCVTDANIDTVSAGKVSGVLSYFQGGTGIGGPGPFPPAGLFLRSNGAGWETSGLTASDIPGNLGSYIQNTTTTQATSNFNVSGNGTVGGILSGNVVNSVTQFNIGGNRILSVAGNSNVFAGVGAGTVNTGASNAFFGTQAGEANTTANNNAFFGRSAGRANTGGGDNSFFGAFAGNANTTGQTNSFFGSLAGISNTTGQGNSIFGYLAGGSNTNGGGNSFFGLRAGEQNTNGTANSFFGGSAGSANTLGALNTFIGDSAGNTNTTGSNNTIIGSSADVSGDLTYATAIGAGSIVSSSNTVMLGRALDTVQIPGALNVTGATTFGGTLGASIFNAATQYNIGGNRILSAAGITNLFVGIDAGAQNTGFNNSFFGRQAGQVNTNGSRNSFFGTFAGRVNNGDFNSFFGSQAGELNVTGQRNSFFGNNAGKITDASANSFFGESAGIANTSGFSNSFLGVNAGDTNTTGNNNTIVGTDADVSTDNLTNATAIGAGAIVSQSNSLVLGSNANVGIGTTAPSERLHVVGNGLFTGNLTVNGTLNAGLPTGSTNYIQNQNAVFQPGNFTIDGIGTAQVIRAESEFRIGPDRVLSIGVPAGDSTYVGRAAGQSFTGSAIANSFFGAFSGQLNAAGDDNSFFGANSGQGNTSGSGNTFVGKSSGLSNTIENNNTFIGAQANGAAGITNATALGFQASVSQSNSLVLGNNANVGIGTSTPGAELHVVGNTASAGNNTAIFENSAIGPNISHVHFGTAGDWYIRSAASAGKVVLQDTGGNVSIGTSASESKLHVDGTSEILSTGSGAGFKFRDRGSTSSADDWVWYSNGNIARFFRAGPGDLLTIQTGPTAFDTKYRFTGGVQVTTLYATGNANPLIISSPNLTCFAITVNNIGQLGTHVVTCP